MLRDIEEIKKQFYHQKGTRDAIESYLKALEKRKMELTRSINVTKKAQIIIQTVAKQTQEEVEFHIMDIISLAMRSVFDEPYRVVLDYQTKRGKTEVGILFEHGDKLIDPLSEDGGGASDVAAFAFQVALWCIQQPRTRNVMILDEPLKFLKGGDLPSRGAQMIKKISEKLKLQIIMVSHIPEQVESSDKVFHITKNKEGISIVS